jgi:hypothetical protein
VFGHRGDKAQGGCAHYSACPAPIKKEVTIMKQATKNNVYEGDTLVSDGSLPCLKVGQKYTVKGTFQDLYITCRHGPHYLIRQGTNNGNYRGFWKLEPGYLMPEERRLTTGLLAKNASFRLIVTGEIGTKEIDRLIAKLQIDKEILAEQDAAEIAKQRDSL